MSSDSDSSTSTALPIARGVDLARNANNEGAGVVPQVLRRYLNERPTVTLMLVHPDEAQVLKDAVEGIPGAGELGTVGFDGERALVAYSRSIDDWNAIAAISRVDGLEEQRRLPLLFPPPRHPARPARGISAVFPWAFAMAAFMAATGMLYGMHHESAGKGPINITFISFRKSVLTGLYCRTSYGCSSAPIDERSQGGDAHLRRQDPRTLDQLTFLVACPNRSHGKRSPTIRLCQSNTPYSFHSQHLERCRPIVSVASLSCRDNTRNIMATKHGSSVSRYCA